MNKHVQIIQGLQRPAATTAADGLPRRAFTIADVEKMTEAGILRPDERFELLGGELVVMNAKGIAHEQRKVALNMVLARFCIANPEFSHAPETTFRLDEYTFLEPDFVVYPTEVGIKGLNGEAALLTIEIADTSLSYDIGRKKDVYAAFGIRELWVIDVRADTLRIFRDPTPLGYRTQDERSDHLEVAAAFVPGFSLRLRDLTVS